MPHLHAANPLVRRQRACAAVKPFRYGGFIRIAVGTQTTEDDLNSDWMLTHEMVHLTFPNMQDEHHWIEEGIATYVEPIARIQAGQFSASRMWFELVRDMPKACRNPATKVWITHLGPHLLGRRSFLFLG